VELAKQLRPAIVVLDIGMPTLNGLKRHGRFCARIRKTRVLILTITDTDEAVRAVLDAGARGFLLKSDAARDLLAAIEALQFNKTFFTARVAEMVLSGYRGTHGTQKKNVLPNLTPRERESSNCSPKANRQRKSRLTSTSV